MDTTTTNLLGVLRTLFRWKWTIVILAAATFVGTAGISLLLPNYYKATTTFFAASEDMAKPESLFSQRGSNIRTQYYGNENDLDRLLTVAQSNELKDYLIDSFQLFEHYKMKPNGPKARYRLRKKLNKYYDILKTDRDAIELSFEDKDPEFAAKVANAARQKIEEIALSLIRSNQSKSLLANEENVTQKEKTLTILSDSLSRLREVYGIYDGLQQTQDLSEMIISKESALVGKRARLSQLREARGIPKDTIAYIEADVKGLQANLDTLNVKMELWRNGIASVLDIEKQYFDLAQALSGDRERTRVLKATYEASIPAVLVVEEAEVPLYKSRPGRSILVLAATFIVVAFSILGILLFESYKDVDWRSIIHA